MFRTTLQVAHVQKKYWRLTKPLVYEGDWEIFIIRTGFVTDFASIPKPVRWLLDNAGRNSEAAVLHDALWRESQRGDDSRIDPWYVDGLFRRALYETGSITLSRSLMWFAVRLVATISGRLGKLGPGFLVKIAQLAFVFGLGMLTAAIPTLIAAAGLFFYWVASWVVAAVWHVGFERRKQNRPTNWPWPMGRSTPIPEHEYDPALLRIIKIAPSPDEVESGSKMDVDLGVADRLRAALDTNPELTGRELDQILSA